MALAEDQIRQIGHIIAVMDRHQNDEDGGERPFNETGEAMEAIRAVIEDRDDPIVRAFLEEPE
jgi:hypothetical protein